MKVIVVGAGLPHLPAVLSASKSYSERLFKYARSRGLKSTAHVFETADGTYPELLPYIMASLVQHDGDMLLRATQLQPENARAYYVMGILYDKKSRSQEAAAMYRKAREVGAA